MKNKLMTLGLGLVLLTSCGGWTPEELRIQKMERDNIIAKRESDKFIQMSESNILLLKSSDDTTIANKNMIELYGVEDMKWYKNHK